MDGSGQKPNLEPGTLLRVSEHFLRRRHFDDCRSYAHRVYEIDPNFPGVSEILAVTDVLIASKHRFSTEALPDWYAILQLDRFSKDTDLIRQRFNHLYGLLDPKNNKFPLANEAFDLVCDAWYVLSNPLKRLEYDDLLKKHLDDKTPKENSNAFWTVCPYCYYLYEYHRAYLELCLRCPNEKCSKAFTCVEIEKPPVEVLTEGKYMCDGFLSLGFHYDCWNPFAVSKKQKVNATNNAGNFVEIPDDDDDDEDDVEVKSSKPSVFNGEGVNEGSGNEKTDGDPTKKLGVRRTKSVARKSKATDVRNRVTKDGSVQREQPEVMVRSTDDEGAGFENDRSCKTMEPMDVGEQEVCVADDDILVSPQNAI